MADKNEILLEMIFQGFPKDRVSKYYTDKIIVEISVKIITGMALKEAVKKGLIEAQGKGLY
ncbi:MAG: hypothetical protein KAU50_02840 [Candidatus Marinimicrobia bacterium]|nr:hypothetical protein [Candidatus Neomarinimicrobiota bacterium]